ncbi:S8 family serine peptidase, partial [Phaeodactylibacter luteus]
MKIKFLGLITIGLLWVASPLRAQDYSVGFHAGEVPGNAFSLPSAESDSLFAAYLFEGNYYLIMQFEELPDLSVFLALQQQQIELFAYIPNYAYLAKIPHGTNFENLGVRALAPYLGAFKLNQALAAGNYPDYAYDNGLLDVLVSAWQGIPLNSLAAELQAMGYEPVANGQGALAITIPEDSLLSVAEHPAVQYVQLPEPEPVHEGWVGRSSHRLNLMSQGPGLGFDGAGEPILIGDDGSVDHQDFKGRLINNTATNFGTHGDMTLGLAGGAGNIDPLGMGAAPGASLYLYDIAGYPQISNAVQLANSQGFAITSTSFGEGCGGVYSSTSRDIDRQVKLNPNILHFFSAGNSASSACSNVYGSVVVNNFRYGNITGGRKAGKNVFAVANLFYDDNRVASSSRGPTEDGRIKPDLGAHGQGNLSTRPGNEYGPGGGTSAAAPSLAGTAAALVQAFRASNNGQAPSAALMKGILLNTADDLGNPGPDYDFGWGRVHAARALEVIQNNQYFTGAVANGGNAQYSINVPPGTDEVRVMVYWTDVEGTPVAAKALVNDLDLTVSTPGGSLRRPWKLSTVPHPDSLTKPAYRGEDHINNVEQVSISNPQPGTYTVKVEGYLIPQLAQDYVVVYTFLKDELELTYPVGGEGFTPGEVEVIRWDALSNSGSFTLEYSANGGSSWNTISSSILGSRRYFNWTVPNIVSGQVRLRVRRGSQSSTSPENLTIIRQPAVSLSTVPGNKVKVSWNAVAGADSYKVYRLGEQFMELVATTPNTSFEVPAASGEEGWYAVAAGMAGSGYGRRSTAQPHTFFACETEVTLTFNFDFRPQETTWRIQDASGNVVASGGPYMGQTPLTTLNITECLPYGCFELLVFDSYGDGMCCANGNGSFQLADASGQVLVSGGTFGSTSTTPFCLESGSNNPLNVQLTGLQGASCSGASDGSVTAVATGGTGIYTYNWSNGASVPSLNNLSAGTYSITVSDGAQQVTRTAIISEPNPILVDLITVQPSCSNTNDGIIQASVSEGLEADYTYQWNNGATSELLTGLPPGFYSVTVTNADGCTGQGATALTSPGAISLSLGANPVSCPGSSDGAAFIQSVNGGSPGYTGVWSTGQAGLAISNLGPGNYSVTVSDTKGCSASGSVTVGGAIPINISVSTQAAACVGSATGSAMAQVSGGQPPYSYQWSNGATASAISGLNAGVYSLTVMDNRGCTAIQQAIVQQSAGLTVDVAVENGACGGAGGSATAVANGGQPPFSYAWSNGATGPSLTGLAAG